MKEREKSLSDQALATLYNGSEVYAVTVKDVPRLSYYKPPINAKDPTPVKNLSLHQVYKAIKGDFFKALTLEAQNNFKSYGGKAWPGPKREHNPFRIVKERKLHYVTFGGTFSQRANKNLIEQSGYYCFDLDHLKDIQKERERILAIQDDYFTTNLLFASPSGEGLKWVLSIAANGHEYKTNYEWLRSYLKATYGLNNLDNTQDVARACFLCHDQNAYYYESI